MSLFLNLRGTVGNPIPLVHAHSHNDYLQSEPLELALAAGFCSIEADVHIKNNDLFTGHVLPSSNRLYSQYLKPLAFRAANYSYIHKSSKKLGLCDSIILLIDMKTNWKETWDSLEGFLSKVNDESNLQVFQCFNSNGPISESKRRSNKSPVQVIVSGISESNIEEFSKYATSKLKWCSLLDDRWSSDGQLNPNVKIIRGMVSAKYSSTRFENLSSFLKTAHESNALVRFWDTPDDIQFWDKLITAGVDLISTDRIAGLQAYLSK